MPTRQPRGNAEQEAGERGPRLRAGSQDMNCHGLSTQYTEIDLLFLHSNSEGF